MEEKIVQANFQTEKLFKKFLRTSIVLIVLGVVISCIEYMFDSYAQYVYNSFFKFFYYSMTSPYRRIKWDIIAYPIYIGLLGIPLSYIFKSIINKCTLEITESNVIGSTIYRKSVNLPFEEIYSFKIGFFNRITLITDSKKINFWFVENKNEICSVLTDVIKNRESENIDEKAIISSKQFQFQKFLKTSIILSLSLVIISILFYIFNFDDCRVERGDYGSVFHYSLIRYMILAPFEISSIKYSFGLLLGILIDLGIIGCVISLLIKQLSSSKLTVTDKRIFGKTYLGKRVDIALDLISSVGTNALKGLTIGSASGKFKFVLIKNRNEVHSIISKIISERQNKLVTKAPTLVHSESTTNTDELKRFKELLDMGAITQEEFDAKKKQLLGL